ncbi:CpsD/CapB family tyrosine-protein kinase [Arenibacterium sp. CAU 1754]
MPGEDQTGGRSSRTSVRDEMPSKQSKPAQSRRNISGGVLSLPGAAPSLLRAQTGEGASGGNAAELTAIDPAAMIWRALRRVMADPRAPVLGGEGLAAASVRDPLTRSFGLLRTRLVHQLRENGWSRVAIVSPTPGCGATFTAVRLAMSLSRVPNWRTILLDLNMRRPGIAEEIGVRAGCNTSDFLAGDFAMDRYLVRTSHALAVGLSHQPSDDADELLIAQRSADILAKLDQTLCPDVTLYDLPPMLESDDLLAFLPQVDGVLLVADATKSSPEHLRTCQQLLAGQTEIFGVVLNHGLPSDVIGNHV